jgi:hypothetical protein
VTAEDLFVDDAYHRRGEVCDGVDAGGDSGGLGGGGRHVSMIILSGRSPKR